MPSPETRIDWRVQFLQRDLTTLRPGERLDLDEDCARLLAMRDPSVDLARVTPPGRHRPRAENAAAGHTGSAVFRHVDRTGAGGAPDRRHALRRGPEWDPWKDEALRPIFHLQADGTITRSYAGTYTAILLASGVDLLVQAWPLLRRCAYAPCRRLFRPTHGRQHYHTLKCSRDQRWRTIAAKRDREQELINRTRRETVKQKTTKKRGPR